MAHGESNGHITDDVSEVLIVTSVCLGTRWLSGKQESSAELTNQRDSYAFTSYLARLVSMPVIFYLLPSSNIVILVFYLFSTGISEAE